MRKSGVLSDRYFEENCMEHQSMKVGLAQRLYPLRQNALPGVPIPSVLPVAQRGFNLQRVAISLAQQTNRPVEDVLQLLKRESNELDLKRVFRPIVNVSRSDDQPSLLAVKRTEREPDIDQLNRAFVTPEGNVVAKSGRIDKFMVQEIVEREDREAQEFSKPEGGFLPPEERM